MSRKFRVNASRKPVKCADAGSDVYFVVLDSAGNIVSTSIVDADIADRTARQLRSGGRKVRKFTNEADYNAFLDKCDESRHENSRMSKKSVGASTKRKRTVKAARSPKIEDWGDGPVKVFWKSGKWSIIMDGYGLGITDGWGVERPIIYTHKNPPTVAYDGTAVSVPPYVKRKFEELVQKGVLKNRSDLYDSGEWDTYFEASTSTKRKYTIEASAKTDLTRKLSKLYNAYTAIDDDKALKRAGMTLAEYNALPDVFERLQKNGHVNTFMTGLANYFKKFGFSVSLDGTDYEITASSSTKRRFAVNASTGKSKTIEVHFNDGRKPAKYTASVLEDMMTESNVDYIIDAETGELIYDSEHGDVRGSKSVKCSARPAKRKTTIKASESDCEKAQIVVDTILTENSLNLHDYHGNIGSHIDGWIFIEDRDGNWNFNDNVTGISALVDSDGHVMKCYNSYTVDGSENIECSEDVMCWVDPVEARFMVDLMYGPNGGYAEDRYFDDWSEVEAYAHDGLMRGFYARIWDKQTGDTITISPDEYAEAWENGAADFDINEDIVNFKNRVVTSSTKIQCDDQSGGTYCIVYNGKVIAETDGLYNGLDDCGESEIAEILLMDDAALKACADYVNSFGDPVLTGDEIGEANEVAMVLAEIISNDYADKSDAESFGDSISWDGNILEWFDSSELADDVTSSTKIEAFRDDTVDETAVRELVLVITNDGDLYRQRTTPIIENLKKKAAKGTYDREKAVKLWQYLADDGVRMYDKEYGSGRGSVAMLNPATRRRIAEELSDYYEEEIMWDINHSDDDSELTTM